MLYNNVNIYILSKPWYALDVYYNMVYRYIMVDFKVIALIILNNGKIIF